MSVFDQEPWPPQKHAHQLVRIRPNRMRDVRFATSQIGVIRTTGNVYYEVELEDADIVRVRKIDTKAITLYAARKWLADRNRPKRSKHEPKPRPAAINPQHGAELALQLTEGGVAD